MAGSHDVRLEAHGHAATLYLHDLLTMERVIRAAALCEGLPRAIRRLRVDLRTVRLVDPEGFAWLAHILTDWRDRRGALVRFDFADRFRRGTTVPPAVTSCSLGGDGHHLAVRRKVAASRATPSSSLAPGAGIAPVRASGV